MSDIERLGAVAEALANLQAAQDAVTEFEAGGTVGSLETIKDDAPSMKIALAERRLHLERLKGDVELRSKELQKAMEAKISEAHAIMRPLEKQMALMQQGIHTLNLYLGRDEEIEQVRDGEPAGLDEPISIRQMVLSMDQESMILAEDGGMDFKNIGDFIDWMVADDAHLDQMLPEKRGVVVLVPRRTPIDYSASDAWTAAAKDAENRRSYWLLRNGERLYLMTTDLQVGERLIPKSDEFTAMFEKNSWGEPVQPGTHAWQRAEEVADGAKRHFMKIAMVLQGLIDRTSVWYPLPHGVSVLSMESYDNGSVRVVSDDERAIGTGLEPFSQWHARICSQMHPGMRVVFGFNESWRSAHNVYGDYKRTPYRLSSINQACDVRGLEEGAIYTLERGKGGLCFRFERTDMRYGYNDWGRWGQWRYQRKGVYVDLGSDARYIMPLDLVTAPELRAYINARTERHQYLSSMPLIKSALAAKEAEATEEAPFRQLLVGRIMQASGDDQEAVESKIDDLIRRWKLGNKWHRALVGMTSDEQSKALRTIATWYEHEGMADTGAERKMIEYIRNAMPDVAVITHATDGTYTALAPQPGAAEVFAEDVYWVRRQWTKTGKPKGEVTEWHYPRSRSRVIFETEVWTNRKRTLTHHDRLSKPELDALVAWAVENDDERPMRLAWNRSSSDEPGVACYYYPATKQDRGWMRGRHVYWKRAKGGVEFSFNEWTITTSNSTPWMDSRGTRVGRHEWVYPDRTIWIDKELDAKYQQQLAAADKDRKRNDRLRAQSDHAFRGFVEQWTERFWNDAHAEFLSEYGGREDLWEAHRKTLKVPQFPYSKFSVPRRGGESGDLADFLKAAMSSGIDVHGHTVGETAPLIDFEAPSDVADLVIYTRPRPKD